MRLKDDEKAMLAGDEGPARRMAMELLVRYGEALGAERLVDTNNAGGVFGGYGPFTKQLSEEEVFFEFSLDSREVVEIPRLKAFSCHFEQAMDLEHWEMQGVSREAYEANKKSRSFAAKIGFQLINTCAPYLAGNIPVMGEHCAWMESSAVVYCNSVLGARTNTEGRESSTAAMLTGKIPYWGYHIDENRRGTHLVEVEYDMESIMDWGLLGYYTGEIVQDRIPVFNGVRRTPNLPKLKHLGAAAASSGGVEMYHIVGVTPEAHTLEQAFGKNKPVQTLKFGKAERKMAYDMLNSANTDPNVDFVMLGCPHYSIDQVWEACRLLEGKQVKANLWIFVPSAIKELCDRNGYTETIARAGGVLMTDTCPCLGRVYPKGTRVAAVDSAKQAHYLPAILGFPTWFGSQEDCIHAAITGQWEGGLK
jgi:predicted aconitase